MEISRIEAHRISHALGVALSYIDERNSHHSVIAAEKEFIDKALESSYDNEPVQGPTTPGTKKDLALPVRCRSADP